MSEPIQWEIVASMEQVQKEHPEWTEEQCREEFNRRGHAAIMEMVNDREIRKRKGKPS